MAHKRLFVGLRLEADRHPELLAVAKRLRVYADKHKVEMKWSPPANWHITLLFLGETDESRLARLQSRLEAAAQRAARFEVRLSGMGAFPDERHARVIWVGAARSQEILDAQSAVEAEFAAEGFAPEDRDYHPHITLGRLRSSGSVREMIAPFLRRKFGDATADRLVLYESVRRGNFPAYIPLASAQMVSPDGQPIRHSRETPRW